MPTATQSGSEGGELRDMRRVYYESIFHALRRNRSKQEGHQTDNRTVVSDGIHGSRMPPRQRGKLPAKCGNRSSFGPTISSGV